MKTLEELLRMTVTKEVTTGSVAEIRPDFRIAVQEVSDKGVRVIIHPMNYNGDTLDFWIKNNEITPAFE